jgi:hypothetical protein
VSPAVVAGAAAVAVAVLRSTEGAEVVAAVVAGFAVLAAAALMAVAAVVVAAGARGRGRVVGQLPGRWQWRQ